MSEVEDRIYDFVLEKGFSKSFIDKLRDNINIISSEFVTDILIDQINLYLDNLLLFEFLPKIWNDNKNMSKNLLLYLGGLSHKVLYLAREYPLGKEPSAYIGSEIKEVHTYLCDFMSSCLEEVFYDSEYKLGDFNSFQQMFENIIDYPRFSKKISEMLSILGKMFLYFGKNPYQKIRNIDELSLYLSRSLILWKLGSINIQEVSTCFENARKMYVGKKNISKTKEILALELQNYQFLQLGISREVVEIIVSTFFKFFDK